MGNFVEKHRKGLFIFSRNILFFLIALLLVDKFNIINVSRFVNNTFLIVLSYIFLFLSVFFYIKKDEDYYKKAFEPYFKYVFLILLIIITLGSLQFAFLQSLNWFNSLSSLIKLYQLPLVLLTVGFGFLTFYFNRDEVEKEIENEKVMEERQEARRKEEFSSKFPRINRVWGLRSLVRWMYGEGWWYSVGLIAIVVLGFVLRASSLTYFEPYADEYPHLIYAKSLYEGNGMNIFYGNQLQSYTRAFVITLLTFFSFKLFGVSLFSARIIGVIIGSLTGFLFYFILKRFNKKMGLIGVLLWSFSPLAIGISRNVREYYLFHSFFILFTLFLIFLGTKVVSSGWRKLNYLDIVFFFIPMVYTFFDFNSTFKQIFLIYSSFFILLFLYLLTSANIKRGYKVVLEILALFLIAIIFLVLKVLNQSFIDLNPKINYYWFKLFFFNSTNNWFNINFSPLIIALIFFGTLFLFYYKSFATRFIAVTFMFTFYFFTFHFSRYNQPRYGFLLLPLIIYILSYGFYISYKFLFKDKNKYFLVGFIIFLLLVLNYSQIFYTLFKEDNLRYEPTNEYHDRYSIVLDNFSEKINSTNTIVCSLCGPLFWNSEVNFVDNNIIKYDYKNPYRLGNLTDTLSRYPTGLIILDSRRGGLWGNGYEKINELYLEEKLNGTIELTSLMDDQWRVFYWNKTQNP